MTNGFAKVLSVLFHPSFAPTWGIGTVLLINPHALPIAFVWSIIGYVFAGTFILPFLSSLLLVKAGVVTNLLMRNAKERKYPYLIASFFMFMAGKALLDAPIPAEGPWSLIAGGAMMLVLLALLGKWKISAHMSGLGSYLALVIFLAKHYEINLISWIALIVLIMGLVGVSRLKLKAHTPTEVILGTVVSFTIVFLTLSILS